MIARRFVDSNILIYAISKSPGEKDKASKATELLNAVDLAVSVQVLQEFYVQATRPFRAQRLSHEQATLLIEVRFAYGKNRRRLRRGLVERALRTSGKYTAA